MLKFLLQSKDVLYQVSSDLGEVNCFYSSFFDTDQKAPCLSKVQKCLPGTGLNRLTTREETPIKMCFTR